VNGGPDVLAGGSRDNMLTALGSQALKAAIPIIIGLTDMFNNIGVSHKFTQGRCS
jgi:hypothetical protein